MEVWDWGGCALSIHFRHISTWYTWMQFWIWFPNQFQAKSINAHRCALAHLHYSICTKSGCSLRLAAFCRNCRRKSPIMYRICERMVQQAAHQNELALVRRLRQRPKKTPGIETLGLYEKSSSKYTTVHFREFSCMSLEKQLQRSNYRVVPPIRLLAGSARRHTGFHEQCS